MTVWGLIAYLVKNETFLFITITVILLISGLVETIGLLFIAPIVDIITSAETGESSRISDGVIQVIASLGLPTELWFLFCAYIVIIIINGVATTTSLYLVQKIKYSFCTRLFSETVTDIFNAKWLFFTSIQQGKLLNTFTRELQIVGDTLAGFGRLASTLLQALVFVIVPFYVSWKVMSITMAIIIIMYLPLLLLGKMSERLGKMNTSAGNDFMTSLQESLGTVKIILGYGAQEKNKNLILEKFDIGVDAAIKTAVFDSGLQSAMVSFAALGLASVFFVSRSVGVSLSEIAIIFVSFVRISGKIGQIIKEKTLLDRSLPSLGQVDEIRSRAVALKQTSGSIPFKLFQNNISIRDLTFAYPDHEPALKNISMNIAKSSMVAVVGESGAGKSTLIDVIMGFNEPDSGTVILDGIPLQEYDINSYRGRIGYVPQESILFNMTIAENIRWANGKASIEEIKHACQSANADSFIESFPDQYDTLVGDRGVRLSGGQLQRVALARAIVRKPDILILDEATSSLDTKSERQIQEAIEKITTGTTVIVIAHRLSTILKADQIYVMEKGEIIENGGYQELLRNNSLFSQMVKTQAFTNNILK